MDWVALCAVELLVISPTYFQIDEDNDDDANEAHGQNRFFHRACNYSKFKSNLGRTPTARRRRGALCMVNPHLQPAKISGERCLSFLLKFCWWLLMQPKLQILHSESELRRGCLAVRCGAQLGEIARVKLLLLLMMMMMMMTIRKRKSSTSMYKSFTYLPPCLQGHVRLMGAKGG